MNYYKVCPHCGANLDPGEVCDCKEEREDGEGKYDLRTTRNISGTVRIERPCVRICGMAQEGRQLLYQQV